MSENSHSTFQANYWNRRTISRRKTQNCQWMGKTCHRFMRITGNAFSVTGVASKHYWSHLKLPKLVFNINAEKKKKKFPENILPFIQEEQENDSGDKYTCWFFMKAGKTNFMMHFQLLRVFCPLTIVQNTVFCLKIFSFVFRSKSLYLRKHRTVNPVLHGCLNMQFRKKLHIQWQLQKVQNIPLLPLQS